MTAEKLDTLGINASQLVELYREGTRFRDETFASRVVAEALTSESTALQSQSAEAIASIAAEAIAKFAGTVEKPSE